LLLPASGTQFMSIQFGEECAMGENSKSRVDRPQGLQQRLCHILSGHSLQEAAEALFASGAHPDALKFEANTARLAGSKWYELPSGREWKWMV
jgi:hypothetical protein